MARQLADVLADAVPARDAGPDLARIEADVARRRRSVGAVVVLVLAAASALSGLLLTTPAVPVIGGVSEASTCGSTDRTAQVLGGTDLDGDALPDRAMLRSSGPGRGVLALCLSDGRELTLGIDVPSAGTTLAPLPMGDRAGVAVLGARGEDGTRLEHWVWLLDGEVRQLAAAERVDPDGVVVELADR